MTRQTYSVSSLFDSSFPLDSSPLFLFIHSFGLLLKGFVLISLKM